MKTYSLENLKFVTMPEGSNSEVSFTISFDAVDTSDSDGAKVSTTAEVIGLAWNSTLTEMVNQAKDTADTFVRDLNKKQHAASLKDALEIVAREVPNIHLTTDESSSAE